VKIVLTGHLGFIGSNLKKYLEKLNYEIIGIDLKSGKDILDCELPICDLVIHLAGIGGVRESIHYPEKYWKNNVEGTRRILEHYHYTRVLVASSSSQYEPHLNPYAASKNIIEHIPHKNVVFMRFHTVYGDNQRKGMFLEKFTNNSLMYVTDHYRDFIHVDDVCEAILILMLSDIIGPVDIGTGCPIKISDLCPNKPIIRSTPYERQYTCADLTILKSLGFVVRNNIFNFIEKLRI
jgi:nucleoside-diphosphate-sugar epimerase